jgi:TetR/AcrR family transcriptional regulator, cholesterol catabolism regulator
MGRRNKSNERRGQILKVAASLFVKHGYLNTSVRDIANKCNMNVATLYHYIGAKEKILGLFQEYTTGQMKSLIEKYRDSIDGMNPVDALVYTIQLYMKWVEEYQDVTVFWYQESKNLTSEQMKNLTAQELYTVEIFEDLLSRGVQQKAFKVEQPKLAAHNIVVQCDMWAFRRWLLKRDFTYDQYVEYQTDLILSQLSVVPKLRPH